MLEQYNYQNIPPELHGYFHEISERLWSNHAAVMVGSGFSKNAKKVDETKKDFPAWYELGNILFEKIYGELPVSKTFLNLLKLADEVQAAYGRPMLDQLLRQYIPDKDHEPSQIFFDLLELPWSDVFTTNYDTLLERSTENVITQRYDIVINQDDLIHAIRPRLIKLHGSFPSERPLIITEEDYRTYPKKFAPFVNTVQQSLLENTLCLIGFSGDDPNFLQWVGWINDNLGRENASKIYLVGALQLSNAQKKLLESKNIVLVDLSMIPQIGHDKKRALEYFLNYLYLGKKKATALQWPFQQKNHFSWTSPIDISALLLEWGEKRKAYPNWILTPADERMQLWNSTIRYAHYEKIFEILDVTNDLEYAEGLTWRLERCLCPIFENIANHIKPILTKYDPITSRHKIQNGFIDSLMMDERRINLWVDTALRLLRYYRESNLLNEFNDLKELLTGIKSDLSPAQLAHYHFETAIHALYRLDIEEVLVAIQSWPVNESLPFWEAKRAGLLAGLGNYMDAERILARSVYYIRKRLNLSPVLNDYTWVSQEAYVMLLQRSVRRFVNLSQQGRKEKNRHDEDYSERWSYFAQYKSDPMRELNYFEPFLAHYYDGQKTVFTDFSFNVGETDTLHDSSSADNESYFGYALFKFLEDIGFPPSLQPAIMQEKIATGGLKRIVSNTPAWALTISVHVGFKEGINAVLSRSFLMKLRREQIDYMIATYLESFHRLLPQLRSNRLANNFIMNLPDVLSRLSVKCSEESKIKIYYFLSYIYHHRYKLNSVSNLIKRLVNSSTQELQLKMLPLLLEIPLLESEDDYDDHNFPEIISFLIVRKKQHKIGPLTNPAIINSLIADANSDLPKRRSALTRLFTLFDLGELNYEQEKLVFAALWAKTDALSGLPLHTKFYRSGLLNLPVPDGVVPIKLFKNWVLKGNFNIHATKEDTTSFDVTGGNNIYAFEIKNGSQTFFNENGVEWTSQELEVLWKKCLEWWNADKEYLLRFKKDKDRNNIHSLYGEFQQRFSKLSQLISDVFGKQQVRLDAITRESILDVVREMEQHEVPVLRAMAAFNQIIFKGSSDFSHRIEKALVEGNREIHIDALNAVIIYGEILKTQNALVQVSQILVSVNQPLKWRINHLMQDCVNVISYFLKNMKEADFMEWVTLWTEFLTYYLDRSDPEVENGVAIDEKLHWRKMNIKLASSINRYLSFKSIKKPDIISHWELIVKRDGEFKDITGLWHE